MTERQHLLMTFKLILLSQTSPVRKYEVNEVSELKSLSGVRLFATPWTVAYQVPQSMEFSRQEYWSGLSFLSPGDLPDPGIKPGSPAFQADALTSEPQGKTPLPGILDPKTLIKLIFICLLH